MIERAHALRRPAQVLLRVADLLLDVLRLEDFVEILHADVAAGAGRVRGVVRPGGRVDAPSRTAPLVMQPSSRLKRRMSTTFRRASPSVGMRGAVNHLSTSPA